MKKYPKYDEYDVFDGTFVASNITKDFEDSINKLFVDHRELKFLVRKLISLLDTVEESDSGSEFHPTTIRSCRTEHVLILNELIPELKRRSKYDVGVAREIEVRLSPDK